VLSAAWAASGRNTSISSPIDKAKFRKPVVPGDTIEYHVTKIARRKKHVVVSR